MAKPGDWLGKRSPFRPGTMATEDYIDEIAGAHYVLPQGPNVLTFADLDVSPHKVTEGIPIEYLRHYRVGGYDFGSTAQDATVSGGGIGGFQHPA
jgi:NADH dehydrogenase (ubiquinone) 1 alpha subcomplex subunit 9